MLHASNSSMVGRLSGAVAASPPLLITYLLLNPTCFTSVEFDSIPDTTDQSLGDLFDQLLEK